MSGPARADLQQHTGPTGADLAEPARGAVFTRPWVADMILDLAGYTVDKDLCSLVVVEPSCGSGVFVSRIAQRLAESAVAHGRDLVEAAGAVRAYDVSAEAVRQTRAAAVEALVAAGASEPQATDLARVWVGMEDFLLNPPDDATSDFVVGNPPYVRVEDVPRETMSAYRAGWLTMTGRADVYVGFLEAGLRSLAADGVLAFICADRWMRNQYGAGIRKLVERDYAVDVSIVLHDVDAFEDRVAAYPAVVVIRRGEQGVALMAETGSEFGEPEAKALVSVARRAPRPATSGETGFRATWRQGWFRDVPSWPVGPPDRLALIADLESRFRAVSDSGRTRIGIGVATGADSVFTTTERLVEADRLIPLVGARDIAGGTVEWLGRYLLNPWAANGDLVDLDEYPKLAGHLREHEERLRARHVVQRQPDRWWRTIDTVSPAVARSEKLLLPDLKATVHPVLDSGCHYPSHNLYYIVSEEWDLKVLGALLMSDVGQMFVEAYSVRMANGCLRVTSQYLRRVRVPDPAGIPASVAGELSEAFDARDRAAATEAALSAYGLREIPAG